MMNRNDLVMAIVAMDIGTLGFAKHSTKPSRDQGGSESYKGRGAESVCYQERMSTFVRSYVEHVTSGPVSGVDRCSLPMNFGQGQEQPLPRTAQPGPPTVRSFLGRRTCPCLLESPVIKEKLQCMAQTNITSKPTQLDVVKMVHSPQDRSSPHCSQQLEQGMFKGL